MKSPLEMFFKMGEKVTGGDPNRQQDFIYYMVWILFVAFLWLFVYNAYDLFANGNLNAATWTLVGFAICGIQYFSLKGLYEAKEMRKRAQIGSQEANIESATEMLRGFDDNDDKEVKEDVWKEEERDSKSGTRTGGA